MPDAFQIVTIDDFTPGIHQWGGENWPVTFSAKAPLGAASTAFRCFGVAGVGLVPFPTYTKQKIHADGANTANNTVGIVCGMKSIPSSSGQVDNLFVTELDITAVGAGPTAFRGFQINVGNNTNVQCFTNSTANQLVPDFVNLVLFANQSPLTLTACTVDPVATFIGGGNPTVMRSINNSTSATTNIAVASSNISAVRTMEQSSRLLAAVWNTATATFGVSFLNEYYSSVLTSFSGFSGPALFDPSQMPIVGAWGSIDAGELLLIGVSNGGVLIQGDIAFPVSVTRLTGLVGTGGGCGPAIATPIGLVYVSDQGVFLWNGGNTSQKISNQIQNGVILRNSIPIGPWLANASFTCFTHHDVWIDKVFFANNWVLDTVTGAWWRCEDPAVANMQVHCRSFSEQAAFYSADGFTTWTGGGLGTLPAPNWYNWNALNPASSWTWTSTPIPNDPSFLSTFSWVEIVASNPSATSATVTITPSTPPGQTPFANQLPAQPVPFTIPPLTTNYRGAQRVGYADFNLCVKVDAANTVGGNSAPILHQLSLGISQTRVSEVTA